MERKVCERCDNLGTIEERCSCYLRSHMGCLLCGDTGVAVKRCPDCDGVTRRSENEANNS